MYCNFIATYFVSSWVDSHGYVCKIQKWSESGHKKYCRHACMGVYGSSTHHEIQPIWCLWSLSRDQLQSSRLAGDARDFWAPKNLRGTASTPRPPGLHFSGCNRDGSAAPLQGTATSYSADAVEGTQLACIAELWRLWRDNLRRCLKDAPEHLRKCP